MMSGEMTDEQHELFPGMTAPISQEGRVVRERFANPDSGYRVLSVEVGGDIQTWVGIMPSVTGGAAVRGLGTWVDNPRFGRQFETALVVPLAPQTTDGIAGFLGSGIVSGVGPRLAERIVARFGAATLDVLEQDPARVAREVKRLGKERAEALQRAWIEQKAVGTVLIWLQGHGITSALAHRIHKRYGARTIEVVTKNPYRLALDISGIGFKTADEIAQRLGVPRDSLDRAAAGVLHCLIEHSGDGHCYTPSEDLARAAMELLDCTATRAWEGVTALERDGLVVVDRDGGVTSDDVVYLAALHAAERRVAARLRALLDTDASPGKPLPDGTPAPAMEAAVDDAIASFEAEGGTTLAPAQKEAVRAAARHKVLVVTGGPGTGKTHLVRAIIKLYECARLEYSLAAPTGRAAKRMSEATKRQATTIHRLLQWDPGCEGFFAGHASPLDDHAIIVDESSMCDIQLTDSLLDALRDGARVVFVGDVDQLPSVGPGAVLRDIIDSGAVPTVRLTQIFRQAEGSLITRNAHRINAGIAPETGPKGTGDFHLIERRWDGPTAADMITMLVATRIPAAYGVNPRRDIQVLAPMNKGDAGVLALNERLQAALNPVGPAITRGKTTLRVGDRVLQTRNDYSRDVFNGDVGFVASIRSHPKAEEPAMVIDFDGRRVEYEDKHVSDVTLAYAMSIHRSQGGQAPVVVVPVINSHWVMLSRNLVYTAVTRGQRLVVMLSDPRAMRVALAEVRRELRRTGLCARLKGEAVAGTGLATCEHTDDAEAEWCNRDAELDGMLDDADN